MSLFRRPEQRASSSWPNDGSIPPNSLSGAYGLSSAAGEKVDPDSAMRLSAFWAAVNLLADLVSTLPRGVYRKVGDGRLELPPPALLVRPDPNLATTSAWVRQIMVSWLLRGNVYGHVLGVGANGYPSSVSILHPDCVRWERNADGVWAPRVEGRVAELYPRGDLWHVPAFTVPGSPVGLSPVSYAAQSIGLGLAAEKFGAGWFGDGAHPSAILSTEASVTEEQAAAMKSRFASAISGRQPAVLSAGVQYQQIQVAPNESQFLDTMHANVATIARFFNIPPEMIGGATDGGSVTYANVEQRALNLLTFAVNHWVVRIEEALSQLIPRPQFVKFNVDALARVDLKSRYEAHEIAVRSGWKSTNEVRAGEELPPIPGGDEYLWPPYATSTGDAPAASPEQPTRPKRLRMVRENGRAVEFELEE